MVHCLRYYLVMDAFVVGHDWVAKDGMFVCMDIVMDVVMGIVMIIIVGIMMYIVTIAMVISIIMSVIMSISVVISVIISMIVSIVHGIRDWGQIQMSSGLVIWLSEFDELILLVDVVLLG